MIKNLFTLNRLTKQQDPYAQHRLRVHQSQHTKATYAEGELTEGATCKERLQVRQEGARAQGTAEEIVALDREKDPPQARAPHPP